MGSSSSTIKMKDQLATTHLLPLTLKVVAVSAIHCPVAPTKMLIKFSRDVVLDNVTFKVHDFNGNDGHVEGKFLYWLDSHHQVLTDGDKRPITKLVGNTHTKGFHAVNLKTNVALFSLVRNMRASLPAELGTFQDRLSGKEYTIGYTGEWTLEHRAIIWIASTQDMENRIPVAKVYPAPGSRMRVKLKYCMEVALAWTEAF